MEKWFVLYNNREKFNILNDYFKKGWGFIEPTQENSVGYCSHNEYNDGNNWMYSLSQYDKMKNNGYRELSWEEFESLILNKEPQYEVY